MVAGQDIFGSGGAVNGTQQLRNITVGYGGRVPQRQTFNDPSLSQVNVASVSGNYNTRFNDTEYYDNWQPSQLTGIAHWYRSDLGITLNGSEATDWADQIGSADLSAASADKRPGYTASDSTIGNNPSIVFVSSGDADRMDATIDDIGQPVSWFVVYKHDGGASDTKHIVGTSYDSNSKYGNILYCAGSTKNIAANDSGSTDIVGPANDNEWTLAVVTFNGSSSRLVIDGINKGGSTESNSTGPSLHVGSSPVNTEFLKADMTIAEFGIVEGAIADRDINILREYAKQRYRIKNFIEV